MSSLAIANQKAQEPSQHTGRVRLADVVLALDEDADAVAYENVLAIHQAVIQISLFRVLSYRPANSQRSARMFVVFEHFLRAHRAYMN